MTETPSQVDPSQRAQPGARLEAAFEKGLWLSRLLVIIAVVFALLVATAVFFFATVDAVRVIGHAFKSVAMSSEALVKARLELLAKVVKVVDLYLVATFMVIFAMGLYELFIGKINIARQSEVAARLLLIEDLDDLKDRLAKIVLLILAMLFLEQALRLQPGSPLDLLYLALGILLVAGALYLSQKRGGKDA